MGTASRDSEDGESRTGYLVGSCCFLALSFLALCVTIRPFGPPRVGHHPCYPMEDTTSPLPMCPPMSKERLAEIAADKERRKSIHQLRAGKASEDEGSVEKEGKSDRENTDGKAGKGEKEHEDAKQQEESKDDKKDKEGEEGEEGEEGKESEDGTEGKESKADNDKEESKETPDGKGKDVQENIISEEEEKRDKAVDKNKEDKKVKEKEDEEEEEEDNADKDEERDGEDAVDKEAKIHKERKNGTSSEACEGDDCSKKCHTAEEGEKCYYSVKWAMEKGFAKHPEWYKGLTDSSTFSQFQAYIHDYMKETDEGNCTKPCPNRTLDL